MRAFLACLLAGAAIPCSAAEIKIDYNKVFVLGTIETGDDLKFAKAVEGHDQHMTVILHSGGGKLYEARTIGRLIRKKGWATHTENWCTSACAIIWLGGAQRSMTPGAHLGFHSAVEPISYEISSRGNHLTEEYALELGYSHAVGRFGTDGKAFKWLTPETAKDLGIKMSIVPPSIPKQTFAHVTLYKQADPPKWTFYP